MSDQSNAVYGPYYNATVEKNTKGFNYSFDTKHVSTAEQGKQLADDALATIKYGIEQAAKLEA